MSRLRRHTTPQTVICRACAVPFVWDGGSARRPHYCRRRPCVADRQRAACLRYYDAHLRTTDVRKVPRPTLQPLPHTVTPQEPADHVERLLRAAAQRRRDEERRTGQRRYTITDAWQQRPGVSTVDRDGSGEGW